MSQKIENKHKKITMSQLSRNHKVSRQALYNLFKNKGWDVKNITSKIEGEVAEYYKNKTSDNKKTSIKIESANKKTNKKKQYNLISGEISSIKQRLENKIQEYNFNRQLITNLQFEIDEYQSKHNGTTMKNHTGSQAAIPQIAQLEKYCGLNLKLDKHIQELEDILGYDDEEDNPYED